MLFQRPIFATLALTYCVCLGAFALIQDRHSKLNRNFAFYNFFNALYNAADYVILIPNHTAGVWFVRIAGIGGTLMLPFLMLFVFELIGISGQSKYKRIGKYYFASGIIFSAFSLTPFVIRDVRYEFLKSPLNTEVPGFLYYWFAVWCLVGLIIILWSFFNTWKTASHLQRIRLTYLALACTIGFLALCVYFISLFSVDLPAVYYGLQALVAFTFAYAIFKHNLISVSMALRRASLLVGIYIGIAILLAPLFVFFHHVLTQSVSFGPLMLLVFISGILFSLGPIAYGSMVRRSAIFQDASTSHLVHEFKTPLDAIQSAKEILDSELAKPKRNTAKIHDYLDMIQRNSERLEKFVLAVLNTVKAGDVSVDFEKEEVDLNKLLTETQMELPQLSGRITIQAADGLKVRGYQEGLRQVLVNLLSNAAKFCPDGRIDIDAQKLSGGIEISIRDEGRGIEKKDLERIFIPFAQSKEGKNIKKGSGLGLAIAQKWVEAHNGKIWAESEGLGKGARFIFFLPFH